MKPEIPQFGIERSEVVGLLPVVEDSAAVRDSDDIPGLKDGVLLCYHVRSPGSRAGLTDRYVLRKKISDFAYFFRVVKSLEEYHLSFKTEEYGQAITNLDVRSQIELFQVLHSFVETIHQRFGIRSFYIDPAGDSHTAEEVKQCVDRILSSPNNTLKREELLKRYDGSLIFDLYENTFNEVFPLNADKPVSRSKGRSRFFKQKFHTWKDWEVVDDYSTKFRLRRIDRS